MNSSALGAIFLLLSLLSFAIESRKLINYAPKLSTEGTKFSHGDDKSSTINGTKWAVLVAGSSGYGNYRHQADVCHAYQILKNGGLKEENIIVFMYDDIAFAKENPRPGTIINKPYGSDVYYGVPKDYTGENVNSDNFLAVILGKKTALTGGSGKVVNSGPNDLIFIYYTDHGAPGMIAMPSGYIYANDLIDVLKKKYEAKAYKSMVIYLEACESGSIFDGLLPKNWNIYATTAANPSESSWALYCPEHYPSADQEYDTCLGDLFSISWLEDSEKNDLQKETLEKQYQVVKRRTSVDYSMFSSHVMRYGNVKGLQKELVSNYIGTNPVNDNISTTQSQYSSSLPPTLKGLDQRDADLHYLWHKFNKAINGTNEKVEAEKQLNEEISERKRVDLNIQRIAKMVYGHKNGAQMLELVRPSGHPLVDDWDCLKMLVGLYEEHCGCLSTYGKKYTRAMANMCNAGINKEKMIMALTQVCETKG